MTNALTVYESGNFELMQRTAQAMVTSGFFKDTRDLSQAIVKVMAGAELGLPPFASMTGINIIQGKPALGSNVIATLVKNSGRYDYRIKQCDEKAAVLTWYDNGQAVGESSFTIEEANRAGLTGKDNWKKYPSDMLFARAISRGARRFAPGIFGGSPVYTPDELGADVDPDGYIDGETVQAPFVEDDIEEAAADAIGDIDAEVEQDEPEPTPQTPMMKPTTKQVVALHAAGKTFYGDDWDKKRAELVSSVTKGRSTSSKHLTRDECQALLDGINKKANGA